MAGFTDEQKQEILERDNFRCQKCGSEAVQAAHVDHRKMGGDPSKNVVENGISFCGKCHTAYDKGQFSINKWQPDDKENGLVLVRGYAKSNEDGTGLTNVIPKEDLYFYQRPSQQLVEVAQKVDHRAKEALQVAKRASRAMIKHIQEMRDRKVDGRPLYKGIVKPTENDETYQTFTEYLEGEILPRYHRWSSIKTAFNMVSAYRALKPASNNLIGVYLAFEKDSLEGEIAEGNKVTGQQEGNVATVKELIDREAYLIARVVGPDDWKEFHEGETVEFDNGTVVTIHQVESELDEIDLGNYADLAAVLRNDSLSNDQKEELIEYAKGPQREFKQAKRDLLTSGDGNAKRSISCKECIKPTPYGNKTLQHNNAVVKLADRARRCPVTGVVIETMSGQRARECAKKMDEEQSCFDPQD